MDAALKPEALVTGKEFYIMEWLKRKFIIRKNEKKRLKENSTVNNTAEVKYAP
jgi:hypothetical protein